MIREKHIIIPEAHQVGIEFSDDFGHKHTLAWHTHELVEDPARPWPLGPATVRERPVPQTEIENIRSAMDVRERAHLKYLMEHPLHRNHPAVLGHPDNPNNPRSKK